MSKYHAFCESLRVGKAKTEEEQLKQQDEAGTIPQAVAQTIKRMCEYFQCPAERVRYIDAPAKISTGTLQDALPPLQHNPDRGGYCLNLVMGLGGPKAEDQYPVWLHLEFAPLKHGGVEFHWGSAVFRLPDEETALFDSIADTINQALRSEYTPGPKKIGF
jgi:hypothetical protein